MGQNGLSSMASSNDIQFHGLTYQLTIINIFSLYTNVKSAISQVEKPQIYPYGNILEIWRIGIYDLSYH